MKKVMAAVFIFSFFSVFAGVIDHGDYSGFPNVNLDAHLYKIARKYFPELAVKYPVGVKRDVAWRQDIRKKASGLNISAKELDSFINCVINPASVENIAAPHPALKEFELYAKGKKEIVSDDAKSMPTVWKELLALPIAERRYTAIPVYYSFFIAGDASKKDRESYIQNMIKAYKDGCADTQGCIYVMLKMFEFKTEFKDDERVKYFRHVFRGHFVNFTPKKMWRATNEMNIWRHISSRVDDFYAGYDRNNPYQLVYVSNPETLRQLAQKDDALRDFIVAIGLTNRHLADANRVAREFMLKSEINYPVLAIKIKYEAAKNLFGGKKELGRIMDLQHIKNLSGQAKIDAVEKYIAAYPDYSPQEMPVTSVALNTHAELFALAGLECFKLGRFEQALDYWIKGGTAEDIGLIAEQIMSIDELRDYCRRKTVRIGKHWDVYSIRCAKNNKLLNLEIISPEDAQMTLRNILAMRLAREGEYEEALQWFDNFDSSYWLKKFIEFKKIADDSSRTQSSRFTALLNMAAIFRFRGDILIGTFLEPDNLIARNDYACVWGINYSKTMFKKPDLPRYSYRFRAAELYRQAAAFAPDNKLKSYCFYTAGTLLKNRAPKIAEKDFKSMAVLNPSLVEKNWFKRLSGTPDALRSFYSTPLHFVSDLTAAVFEIPPAPKIKIPDLPVEKLMEKGKKMYGTAWQSKNNSDFELCRAYFCAAAAKGSNEAYAWDGMIAHDYEYYEHAIAALRKAMELDPESNIARHELGRVYISLGRCDLGMPMLKYVADNEKKDKTLRGLAAYNVANLSFRGLNGAPFDRRCVEKYLKIALDAENYEANFLKEDIDTEKNQKNKKITCK